MVRVFFDRVDPGSATDPTVIHRRRDRLPSSSPAKRVSTRAEVSSTYLTFGGIFAGAALFLDETDGIGCFAVFGTISN